MKHVISFFDIRKDHWFIMLMKVFLAVFLLFAAVDLYGRIA